MLHHIKVRNSSIPDFRIRGTLRLRLWRLQAWSNELTQQGAQGRAEEPRAEQGSATWVGDTWHDGAAQGHKMQSASLGQEPEKAQQPAREAEPACQQMVTCPALLLNPTPTLRVEQNRCPMMPCQVINHNHHLTHQNLCLEVLWFLLVCAGVFWPPAGMFSVPRCGDWPNIWRPWWPCFSCTVASLFFCCSA